MWLFWPPPGCSGSIPGTCPHAACKSPQPGLRQHCSHKTPPPGPPKRAGQRQTDADQPTVPHYSCNSFPRCLCEIERAPSLKRYHPFPCAPFCPFIFMCMFACVCVGVPLSTDDAHQYTAAYRSERNAALCHKCCRLPSFSPTTTCLLALLPSLTGTRVFLQ